MKAVDLLEDIRKWRESIEAHKSAIRRASAKIAHAEAVLARSLGPGGVMIYLGTAYLVRDGRLVSGPYQCPHEVTIKGPSDFDETFPPGTPVTEKTVEQLDHRS